MNKSVATAAILAVALVVWMLSGLFVRPSEPDGSAASASGTISSGPESSNAVSGSTTAPASSSTATADDNDESALLKVEVTPVSVDSMNREVTLQGQVEPARRLSLRAQTSGLAEELPVTKGMRIKEGDLLVQLSNDGRDAQLQEYAAELQSARSEQKASQRLRKQNLQSQSQVERANAQLARARANLSRLQLEIDNTSIKAPFDGILNAIPVELGELIERGSVVADIVDDSRFIVSATAPQQTVAQLQAGQPVKVKLITGDELDGEISFISSVADPGTRSFEIEAAVNNPEQHLAAGVSATITVPVEAVDATLLSPATLALGTTGEIGIKSVNDDGLVEFQTVQLLSTSKQGVWVSGVDAGTRIITLGQGFVNPGDRVDAVPAAQ